MARIMLETINTRAPKGAEKESTKKELGNVLERLGHLQNLLYAEGRHSVLVIIQGMDGSGKDGLIRDVFTSMNPQGVRVTSFKEPTDEELKHDFLWRIHEHTPPSGMIQVFNRSHYEDVLVARVHGMVDDKTARQRMTAINDFEQLLQKHNSTQVLKLYLHLSAKEQQLRLKERMKDPEKMWKYNANDFKESKLWDKYMTYYEDVLEHCNEVPWHVIPADQNWYKSYMVATLLEQLLTGFNMQYPGIKK